MRPVIVPLVAAFVAVATAPASAQLRPAIPPEGMEAEVLPPPVPPPPEEDAYAPLGIRAGGLILHPALTATIGATTNADAAPGGSGAAFGILSPELLIESDWVRHAVEFRAGATFEQYFDGSTGTLSGDVAGSGRVDFADGWSGALAAGYAFEPQDTSAVDFPADVENQPRVHSLTASAGLSGRAGGRGIFSAGVSAERLTYEDAIVSGVPEDMSDRDRTAFTARLRAGYEVTPSLTPFVEIAASRTLFDQTLDNDGLARSSTGHAVRLGFMVDRGPILSGEVAIGHAIETFDDPALEALRALTFDGSLVWSPTSLTTVTLAGSTALRPAADPLSSGSVLYDGSLEVAYPWRRNVTLTGTAGVRQERHQGTDLVDTRYAAGVGATWRMNRTHHLTARYRHEWQESTDPTRAWEADSVRLELRVQR